MVFGLISLLEQQILELNVPRMTLQDQITGNVEHGSKPGTKPYLNIADA